jgi:hypothetical protein
VDSFVDTTHLVRTIGSYVTYELAIPSMRLVSAPRTLAKGSSADRPYVLFPEM